MFKKTLVILDLDNFNVRHRLLESILVIEHHGSIEAHLEKQRKVGLD